MKHIDLSSEVKYKTSRSGGKGGQNVNKVETKVELLWHVQHSKVLSDEQKERIMTKLKNKISDDGIITVTASEDRTQLGNKVLALRKLHSMVQEALKQVKKRKATTVPAAVIQKRKADKQYRSALKANRRNNFED